jgi:Protein of unknown function (DUF4238)
MNTLSHRHHFIPEFFIKGFISPSKMLWVYDKTTDRISTKPRSPKSIFFEPNRNTISVAGQEIDIIETTIFKYLDNLLAKRFKIIQESPIEEIHDNELIGCIDVMAATMYYRTPSTENLIDKFPQENLEKTTSAFIKETITGISKLQISENDKNKLINCVLPFINSPFFGETIISKPGYFKILEIKNPHFILSDNPILYETLPKNFEDLTYSIIFPLTSNRIFYGIKSKTYSLNVKIIKSINLLLAIQAKTYFASSDKVFLEAVVNDYRKIKSLNFNIFSLIKEVFVMINK